MSDFQIIIMAIGVFVGLPAAIWFSIKVYDKFKRKFKIVSVGFESSVDFPQEKGRVYIVPFMTIEKYNDELLQICEAEIIFKDRYGRVHPFPAYSIKPNEIKKTETVKLYDFFFAEDFWKDMDYDIFSTGRGSVTFQIKDGKGKMTQFLLKRKKNDRKRLKRSAEVSAGTIELLDNNKKPTGIKIPVSGIKQAIEIRSVLTIDVTRLIEESGMDVKFEEGTIVKASGDFYRINNVEYLKDKKDHRCQICNTRLLRIRARGVQYPPSAMEKNVVGLIFYNWCPKCREGK